MVCGDLNQRHFVRASAFGEFGLGLGIKPDGGDAQGPALLGQVIGRTLANVSDRAGALSCRPDDN